MICKCVILCVGGLYVHVRQSVPVCFIYRCVLAFPPARRRLKCAATEFNMLCRGITPIKHMQKQNGISRSAIELAEKKVERNTSI